MYNSLAFGPRLQAPLINFRGLPNLQILDISRHTDVDIHVDLDAGTLIDTDISIDMSP